MFSTVDDFSSEPEAFSELDARFIHGPCADSEDVRKVAVDLGDSRLFCVLLELDDFKGM